MNNRVERGKRGEWSAGSPDRLPGLFGDGLRYTDYDDSARLAAQSAATAARRPFSSLGGRGRSPAPRDLCGAILVRRPHWVSSQSRREEQNQLNVYKRRGRDRRTRSRDILQTSQKYCPLTCLSGSGREREERKET